MNIFASLVVLLTTLALPRPKTQAQKRAFVGCICPNLSACDARFNIKWRREENEAESRRAARSLGCTAIRSRRSKVSGASFEDLRDAHTLRSQTKGRPRRRRVQGDERRNARATKGIQRVAEENVSWKHDPNRRFEPNASGEPSEVISQQPNASFPSRRPYKRRSATLSKRPK